MRTYYTRQQAQRYDRTWRSFSEKTLAVVLSLVEVTRLRQGADTRGQPLRILDVACGTGLLLAQLAHLLPGAECYGVDASQAMLTQATFRLSDSPHLHLLRASLTQGETAGLPFAPASFDLITCSNTLHYFSDPVGTLQGLRQLLVPTGHLVIEDYVLRCLPFPWKAAERVIKLYDPQHVRLFTCSDAQVLSRQAHLQVLRAQTFPIDLFCRGWALLLQ